MKRIWYMLISTDPWREFEPGARRRARRVSCRPAAPIIEIHPAATSAQYNPSICWPAGLIGPRCPCPRPGCKQIALAKASICSLARKPSSTVLGPDAN
jgi:hypothetical protein